VGLIGGNPTNIPMFFKRWAEPKESMGDFHFLLDDGKKEKTSWVSNAPNVFFFFSKETKTTTTRTTN